MDAQHEIQVESDAVEIKTCCTTAYQSDVARLLLGDSFHPGGLKLTEHLGTLLHLGPQRRVLCVGSGQGRSATPLAQRFGCQVLWIVDRTAPVHNGPKTPHTQGG